MIRRLLLGVVILFAVLLTMPVLWSFRTSWTSARGTLRVPPALIPRELTVKNYRKLLTAQPALRWTANSLVVVVVVVAVGTWISAGAGYALAKRRFPGWRVMAAAFVGAMMVPGQVTLVPAVLLIRRLKLYNTLMAMFLPALMSPFLVFFFAAYLRGFPDDYFDAAEIDGAGELWMFFRVLVPLAAPAIATMAIMEFMSTWGSFLWQVAVVSKESLRTLPVGIAMMATSNDVYGEFGGPDYGLIAAGAMYTFVPMLLVFLAAQKHFLSEVQTGLK